MKALNVVAAFLGGLALGAAAGVLFAPEKGEDTRSKIAELLRKKGIRLNREEMDDLVDQIASEVKEYVKLDLVEKLTILLSTLTLIFVLIILGTMAAFYLSFMLVYVLASATGSLVAGYAIIGGILILLAFIIYRLRQKLIFQPMVNFLARLFLDDSSNNSL